MAYWEGYMNWPLDTDWVCQTCGTYNGLTWGLTHAQCRCNTCHTQYFMRDRDREILTTPECLLKPEYEEPARILWKLHNIPIDEFTDEMWGSLVERVVD